MKRQWIIFLRISTTLFCVAVTAWIFSHSLQTGAESAGQSSAIVDALQNLIKKIAPNSWAANATGEAYDKLHSIVRTFAHWAEFALLGFSFALCYVSWTKERKWMYIPFSWIVIIPIIDEGLQSFTAGRGAQISDVLVDCFGGICGFWFVMAVLWLVYKISKNKRIGRGGVYGAGKS
jgi:VanZ family protein